MFVVWKIINWDLFFSYLTLISNNKVAIMRISYNDTQLQCEVAKIENVARYSTVVDMYLAEVNVMGFNRREAKLAQRVREVEEQNQMLRRQLRYEPLTEGTRYQLRYEPP